MPIKVQSFLHNKPIANLNKRDLEKMSAILQRPYIVTVFQTVDGFWTLEFAFDEIQRYGIETVRRILKVWANFADSILFVQQHCLNASAVYLEFHGWRFEKVRG